MCITFFLSNLHLYSNFYKENREPGNEASTVVFFFYFLWLCLQIKGLEGASIHMWIIADNSLHKTTPTDGNLPCPYVNLEVVPGLNVSPTNGRFQATILLENPVGKNILTYQQLQLEVCVWVGGCVG